MAATGAHCFQIAASRPCISSSPRMINAKLMSFATDWKAASWTKLIGGRHLSAAWAFNRSISSSTMKNEKVMIKAMADSSDEPVSGLPIDLRGKRAFIAGVADDNGYGWANTY